MEKERKKPKSGGEEAIQARKNVAGGGGWMLRRVATGETVCFLNANPPLFRIPDFWVMGR